jgi:hypothetical protein
LYSWRLQATIFFEGEKIFKLVHDAVTNLEWKNYYLATLQALDAGVAVGLQTRERRKRDLFLSRVLHNSSHKEVKQ